MKSYLELIPITAKVRKRQNRMTLLCIVIAVCLVTAIFSMADMAIRMEKNRIIAKQGGWHISLSGLSEAQLTQLAGRDDVRTFARFDGLNYELSPDYNVDGRTCVLLGSDPAFLTDFFHDLPEGRFPTAENEILLTEHDKALLAVELGDAITVHTPAGDRVYTITGFGGDRFLDDTVVGAYLSWAELERLADAVQTTLEPVCLVRFAERGSLRKTIDTLWQQYKQTGAAMNENAALLALSGFSTDPYVRGLYEVAGILFVLVLTASVFMIAGSLNSRTAERTQFFGMLRCIGASRRQVMHLVRLEALYWCKTAVPIGAGIGVAATWVLCALLRFGGGSEFATIPLFQISGIGIVSGVVTGVLTVLLSSRAPARRASRVSPVAAVSGNAAAAKTAAHPIRVQTGRIEITLGIHHAVSSLRNLFLMTGSFALSIILILSFSVLVQWIHRSLNFENPDVRSIYFMFSLFVYGFLAVITLITAIHTVNSIAMSVSARTKLYGTLRAVGMDGAQVKRMIFAEAATYTTLGFAVGMGLGLPLHHFLYTLIITHYWGTAWQLPLGIIGGILALLGCISLIAPFAPARRICAMSITAAVQEL